MAEHASRDGAHAAVPIASLASLTKAFAQLQRRRAAVASLTEADLGLSASTAHQVAATLRALQLIDRSGKTTPLMRQLIDGTADIATVLVDAYRPGVAIVQDGTPNEFDDYVRGLYGSRGSWRRFRRLLLDAIAKTEPDLDLTPFRYLTPTTTPVTSPTAIANTAAQTELGMYLELLRDAIDNADRDEQERISRHTAKLRNELRRVAERSGRNRQ